MSINSLTMQDSGVLPFLPLDGESTPYGAVLTSTAWYPLMGPGLKPNKKYEGAIRMNFKLFVTSHRLVFVNCSQGAEEEVKNIVVLYRQLVLPAGVSQPLTLEMPWIGSNYLRFAFRVLPEQTGQNGQRLNSIYTWLCDVAMEKGAPSLKDAFQLHDAIRQALADRTSAEGEAHQEEPLPLYTP
ncbi:KLTH0D13068p [Lachancea thermotolerans CBS 6340]|uniref:KLTH0D13068p n=1 Tax=Lachancea thermotolerans (strain ATCC 56472 / CBS 6340 / NRRL Y-8284) TaxID=559295 RepID=C5DF85_LACTC|nr:KLTH0D13068p [Lachancea thermotolerans CBS 6340]CAR22840.1 KLTH0D13068p [Lachancea thermotolerans CBS 6340]